MEEPNKNDIDDFLSTGENAPKVKVLNEAEQNGVLEDIKNANIAVEAEDRKEQKLEDYEETCPHCDTTDTYKTTTDGMIVVCRGCGKAIPLCGKCELPADRCLDCIYCDTANFINYLRGNVTIEKFLANLNPALTDMTTSDNPNLVPSYDEYLNDTNEELALWDIKYWDIYGMVLNANVTLESSEKEIVEFVKRVVAKNKE